MALIRAGPQAQPPFSHLSGETCCRGTSLAGSTRGTGGGAHWATMGREACCTTGCTTGCAGCATGTGCDIIGWCAGVGGLDGRARRATGAYICCMAATRTGLTGEGARGTAL